MNNLLTIEELLLINNKHYSGNFNFVELKNKVYNFIKGYLYLNPRDFNNNKYNFQNQNNAVYVIQEITTGKAYVGSSKEIYKRIIGHKTAIKEKWHHNSNFDSLIKESDIIFFELIIVFTDTREEAYILEQYLINYYNNNGTNLLNIADDVKSPMLGKQHTEETKQILSNFHKTNDQAIEQFKEVLESKKRKLIVNGIEYSSLTEANKTSGFSDSYLRKQLNKNVNPNIYWLTDNVSPIKGITLSEKRKQEISESKKNNSKAMEQISSLGEMMGKRILLNGIEYSSILKATEGTGLAESTIHRALRKINYKTENNLYVLNYKKPESFKVLINGNIYNSTKDASIALGLSKDLVKARIRSKTFEGYNYI